MRLFSRIALNCTLVATITGVVLACGTPPVEPPPPPDPPIVYCVPVIWMEDPTLPDFDMVVLWYYRIDGQPLYISNPMALFPNQQCACGLPQLPPLPGVQDLGLSFGANYDPCGPLPPDVQGYGPFSINDDPAIRGQVDSFFDIFYNAAQIPLTPGVSTQVFSFGGPGTIPPDVVWDVYRKVRIPRGFHPRNLCPPASLSAISLFLVQDGMVFVEPPITGLPPIPFLQFQQNPGFSAFYKVCWVPFCQRIPCRPPVPPCFGDADGNGLVNFADITAVLTVFGTICP